MTVVARLVAGSGSKIDGTPVAICMPLLYPPRGGLGSVFVGCLAGILATCGKPLVECCCGVGGEAGIDMSKPGCMVIGALTMLEAVVTIRGICARGSTGTTGGLLLYSGGIRLAMGTGVRVTVEATAGATVVVAFVLVVTGSVTVSFAATVDSLAVTSKTAYQLTT